MPKLKNKEYKLWKHYPELKGKERDFYSWLNANYTDIFTKDGWESKLIFTQKVFKKFIK